MQLTVESGAMPVRRISPRPVGPLPSVIAGWPSDKPASLPPRPRILFVDDNSDARALYAVCLEYAGFACTTAQDGREAIERIRERRPALILMDVSMPVMDGWEATRRIKANPQTRDIPLYMLTAHVFAEHRQLAVEVGADGFLTKPMSPDALVAEIRRALGMPEVPGGALY